MTSLTNLIDLSVPESQTMVTSELQHLMEEIARKSDNPNVQINLLKLIMIADLTVLQITETGAEKFCRKLALRPCIRYSTATEQVKLLSKELIKKWGLMREQQQTRGGKNLDDLLSKVNAKLQKQQQ
jgi:hypothetical protein